MSIDVLESTPEPHRHTIEDDMESYFYVVLYSSISWAPQLKKTDIKTQINNFFNERRLGWYGDEEDGGSRKFRNRFDKYFIKRFSFENIELSGWIDCVISFQNDPTKWTLEALYEYWKGVASSKDLPPLDREDNAISKETIQATASSASGSSRWSQVDSSTMSLRSCKKRTFEEADLEDSEDESWPAPLPATTHIPSLRRQWRLEAESK